MFSVLLDFEIRSCYIPEDGLELCEPPILAFLVLKLQDCITTPGFCSSPLSFEVHFCDVARASKCLSVSRI